MCTKFEYKILDKVTPCIKFKTDFGQIRSTFHTQTNHSISMVTVKRHLNNYWTEITQICRNSRPEVFSKKDTLENFAKFTENTCARISFLI